MNDPEVEKIFARWRRRIFFTLWATYGAFYLCRVNMSIALPDIMREFGYSKADVGAIGSAFFITYALGQFVNGQLGDKLGARKLITLGILVSALLNISFGFVSALPAMVAIWGTNGYFQATGWAPSVKTLANWFPPRLRGKVSGLYGSSFQVGNILSWLLAGHLCMHYGWRYAFWAPAAIFLLLGVHFYLRCRNSPEDVGLPSIEEYEAGRCTSPAGDEHLGFGFTLRQTLGNPRMWSVGLASLFIGLISYGFLYWIPSYMSEVQGGSISDVALRAIIYPISGSLGALVAGWASDAFFGSRRAPVVVIMSILSGAFVLLFSKVPGTSPALATVYLGAVGFTTFGAHTTIVTALPMDFGTRKAASSAAGFVDSLGYLGATIAGVGTGWLVDNYGWSYALYLWAAGAFAAASVMAALWGYTPESEGYM